MPGQRGYGEPLRREVACSRLRARTRRPSWLYDRWVEPPFVHYYRRVLHARAPATTASVAAVAEVVEAEALESACGCRLFRHLMLPARPIARGGGQLRHPQAPAGPGLAGQPSPRPPALHPDLRVLAKPGRGVLSIIERQALRRGNFAGVDELVTAIRRFCDGWNQRCEPFSWTKDADQILATRNRWHTSATSHELAPYWRSPG